MGYVFECDDSIVWSPSRDVGLLFLSQVRYFEAQLNVGSGLSDVFSDTVTIDKTALQAFIVSLGEWINFRNPSLSLLSKGAAVHLLGILLATTPQSDSIQQVYPVQWSAEAAELLTRKVFEQLINPK